MQRLPVTLRPHTPGLHLHTAGAAAEAAPPWVGVGPGLALRGCGLRIKSSCGRVFVSVHMLMSEFLCVGVQGVRGMIRNVLICATIPADWLRAGGGGSSGGFMVLWNRGEDTTRPSRRTTAVITPSRSGLQGRQHKKYT